jgi:hypothetical protein
MGLLCEEILMFLTADELTGILKDEDRYIKVLKERWSTLVLDEDAEHKLRIGKRTELLGDLEARKSKPEIVEDRASDRNMH